MKTKEEELNDFFNKIKSLSRNIQIMKSNTLLEDLVNISLMVQRKLKEQEYSHLCSLSVQYTPLNLKLEYFYNNVLKISISKGLTEKTFKIKLNKPFTYKSNGILEKITVDLSKEINLKQRIIVYHPNHQHIFLLDKDFKHLEKNIKESTIDLMYQYFGFNIHEEELDDYGFIFEENNLIKLYKYKYKYQYQLIMPNKDIKDNFSFKDIS